MNWDDLRFLLALSRAGSLSAAAAKLGVNHSTVARRLAELERSLGAKLLRRKGTALELTAAGERVAARAAEMEAQCSALDREVRGEDRSLSGRVRIATVDLLAAELSGALVAFSREHPMIATELLIGGSLHDLSRGEADVAVRVTTSPPSEHLFGRRVGALAYAVYGRADLEENAPWIAWGMAEQRERFRAYLAQRRPGATLTFETDAPSVAVALARHGAGYALLPSVVGAREPSLVRLPKNDDLAITNDVWILTHDDLRDVARIRALMGCLADALAAFLSTATR